MELKRQLHPNAVIPIRLNGKAVSREITYNILAFIMIYISILPSALWLWVCWVQISIPP